MLPGERSWLVKELYVLGNAAAYLTIWAKRGSANTRG